MVYKSSSIAPSGGTGGGGVGTVLSVTGLNTNNTDPANPVVKISVDGVTITGAGTPASPLVSSSSGAAVSSVFGRTGAISADYGDYAFNLISGVASVSQGGTGQQTLTAHSILLGEGAVTGVGFATTGMAGRILIDQGNADPSFNTVGGDISISNTGSVTVGTVLGGKIPVTFAGSAPASGTLAVYNSTTGTVLKRAFLGAISGALGQSAGVPQVTTNNIGITASGTNQASAQQIFMQSGLAEITNGALGSGVILPSTNWGGSGDTAFIWNAAANSVNVYAGVGLTVNNLPAGTPIVVPPNGYIYGHANFDLTTWNCGWMLNNPPSLIATSGNAFDLSGSTLAPNITASSLTTVGALASGSLAAGFTPVANALLANSSVTVSGVSGVTGGGIVALGAAITLGMADNLANTLAGYNSSGVFSDVAIGSNLSLISGVLRASASGSGNVVGPSSSTSGDIAIFNNITGTLIADSGININSLAIVTPFSEVPSGTIDGSNTTFTLAHTPAAAAGVQVILDGVTQYNGTDFTVSGSAITFVTAPVVSSTIYAFYNTQTGGGGGGGGGGLAATFFMS